MKGVDPPLKWHGGKHDLADWIIGLMPPRCKKPNKPEPDDPGYLHYVEPFFGGGSVLLANSPEGISEVANDLHKGLTNFWDVLQHAPWFEEFKRRCEATPFSEEEWRRAQYMVDDIDSDEVTRAWAFFVRCRQSMSGRMKNFPPTVRSRTRRGMQDHVSAWLSCVDRLPEVHARLKRVLIFNKRAVDVIRREDSPRTLFYLDPPYLHETRATTGEYEHEMSEVDHSELLGALVGTKHSGGRLEGRFLLSGYRSDLYDSYAQNFGWKRHEMQINNHAAGGKTKRVMTECVWTNY